MFDGNLMLILSFGPRFWETSETPYWGLEGSQPYEEPRLQMSGRIEQPTWRLMGLRNHLATIVL